MKNLFIYFIFLCSCGNTNLNSNTKVAQEHQSLLMKKNTSCTLKITNNDIIDNIFTINIFRSDTTSLKTIFKIRPKIKVLKKKGIYDDNVYLNYVFETPNVYVNLLFKNNEGFYIEKALIKDNEIKLYKSIAIGMLKKDFCNEFAIKETSCDTILVLDEDQTLCLKFVFNQNYLRKIEIESSE